jgi:UMF1 family MFS transporter
MPASGRGLQGDFTLSRPGNDQTFAWMLYDWANSAFATVVMAGFFPVFFKQYWSAELTVEESSFYLGVANSVASLVIFVLAPIMGVVADRGGVRKGFLGVFALIGIAATASLYGIAAGQWSAAALAYAIAVVGFMGANVFYDSLLLDVAPDSELDRISARGFALGYLGGGLLFAAMVLVTLNPGTFGLADAAEAVRLSFPVVALWWALFSVPLFLRVRERRYDAEPLARAFSKGLCELLQTVRELRSARQILLFLLAYWLYIDAVDTIIRMAVDYGLSIGLAANDLIVALLVTQFVGFPAALVFGHIGARMGSKRGILLGLAVYGVIMLWAYRLEHAWEFYVLAVGIGLAQGGVQALSRSLYARMIPPERAGEFFGFYNMLGKFAAVLGPVLMGWISVATGNPRNSIFAVLGLLGLGAVLLCFVREPAKAGNA